MTDNSLKVIDFEFLHKYFSKNDSFCISKDKTINNYEDIGCNDYPKSEIIKTGSSKKYTYYKANISSTLIKNPIYIHDHDTFHYWAEGYQEVEHFEFYVDFSSSRMYIFAPKKVTEPFIKKLQDNGFLKYNEIKFDFSKIGELPNKKSAWGIWKNSEGIIKRIAEFGKGIDQTIDDYSNITTLYLEYEHNNRDIQIVIGLNGRLSTPNKITKSELINIYKDISTVLMY